MVSSKGICKAVRSKAAKPQPAKTITITANDPLWGFAIGWLAQSTLSLSELAFRGNSEGQWQNAGNHLHMLVKVIVGLSDRVQFKARIYNLLLDLLEKYKSGGLWTSKTGHNARSLQDEVKVASCGEELFFGNGKDIQYQLIRWIKDPKANGFKKEVIDRIHNSERPVEDYFGRYSEFYPDLVGRDYLPVLEDANIGPILDSLLKALRPVLPGPVTDRIMSGVTLSGLAYSIATADIVFAMENALDYMCRLGLVSKRTCRRLKRPICMSDKYWKPGSDPREIYCLRLLRWWDRRAGAVLLGQVSRPTDKAELRETIQRLRGYAVQRAGDGKIPTSQSEAHGKPRLLIDFSRKEVTFFGCTSHMEDNTPSNRVSAIRDGAKILRHIWKQGGKWSDDGVSDRPVKRDDSGDAIGRFKTFLRDIVRSKITPKSDDFDRAMSWIDAMCLVEDKENNVTKFSLGVSPTDIQFIDP